MSTNDDSASRRGRNPVEGERRNPAQERDERWEQSSRDPASGGYPEQRGREPQRPAFSNFSRHAYEQPRQVPQPPAPPPFPPRNEPPRFADQNPASYVPPPSPYAPEPGPLDYRRDPGDDLFMRDTPQFEPAPIPAKGPVYQDDLYEQPVQRQQDPYANLPVRQAPPAPQPPAPREDDAAYYQRETRSPLDDYDQGFAAQERQASRFYLPEDQPQAQPPLPPRSVQPERGFSPQPDRGYAAQPPKAPVDRGFAPQQGAQVDRGYAPQQPQGFAQNAYAPQDEYGARFPSQGGWADDAGGHGDDLGRHNPHADELDEDFFADEDELEQAHAPARKRSRKLFVAAALVGAMTIGGGGAYLYKSMSGPADEAGVIRADNSPLKAAPENPGGKQFPNGEKTIYDRLTPDGQVQAAFAAPAAPQNYASASASGGQPNSLEDRIDEALRKAQRSGDAPQMSAPVGRSPDLPTVVRSEVYRPDGTRVDTNRSSAPSIASAASGELPPPFGNGPPSFPATQAVPSPAPAVAPFRTGAVPTAPAPVTRSASLTPSTAYATPPPAGSFWVSLKSAPDEKAIQRDIPFLTGKFKRALGDVPVQAKIADLGAKGVTFRAVAGPLGTRREAMELCQRIKGIGGDKSCFVTN
ncbi:hypothetical protein KKP04_10760 [Rhodomicrobium sp. Az07]|uniref:hypothetical protein n=1 Tax=Rhodomicrobium sp. Az07 TaxID=2839034 RepID=UPI001BEA2911|nr:hypothetical protein [Rhodomicrobium sp. Az07]MBT3071343.1 hypothetical protein [Rhodomicrobium sp. Az07]